MFFKEYLYKYGLHDCSIDKISSSSNSIVFTFGSGVYFLDDDGKETTKTPKCDLNIIIDLNDKELLEQYVEINSIYKGRIKDVELNDFLNVISNSKLDIDNSYCSYFDRSILIEGYSNKIKFRVEIKGIKNISFIFYRNKHN